MGVVGVDEAGRGCLAGPVIAGAVLLPVSFFKSATNRKACANMNDSKQVKEELGKNFSSQFLNLEEKMNYFGHLERLLLRRLSQKILWGLLV